MLILGKIWTQFFKLEVSFFRDTWDLSSRLKKKELVPTVSWDPSYVISNIRSIKAKYRFSSFFLPFYKTIWIGHTVKLGYNKLSRTDQKCILQPSLCVTVKVYCMQMNKIDQKLHLHIFNETDQELVITVTFITNFDLGSIWNTIVRKISILQRQQKVGDYCFWMFWT